MALNRSIGLVRATAMVAGAIMVAEEVVLEETGGALLKTVGVAKTKIVDMVTPDGRIVQVEVQVLPPGPKPKDGPTARPKGKPSEFDVDAEKGVGRRKANAYPRDPLHHLLPQEYRDWFAERGIDVDDFTVNLSEGDHSALHTMKWNEEWEKFIDANPGATPDDVWNKMDDMMKKYKIDDLPIEPYDR